MAVGGDWFEGLVTQAPLTLWGELLGWDASDLAIVGVLTVGDVTLPPEDFAPLAPAVGGSLPTRTTSALAWVAADNTGRSPVTGWTVQRRSSTDDGVNFGAWAQIAGSPFSAGTSATNQSGLATGTPEVLFEYRVRGINVVGNGAWSNVVPLQWAAAPLAQPAAPLTFALAGSTPTSRAFNFSVTADASVTKFGLFEGAALRVDSIPTSATTYDWLGLTPEATYTNVNLKQFNGWAGGSPAGWGPASVNRTFTQPAVPGGTVLSLPGCSSSTVTGHAEHGGTEDWPGWRVYNPSVALTYGARTGTQGGGGSSKPLFLAIGDGATIGGANPTYTSAYNEALDYLNTFYYTSPTGQTHTSRWNVKVYYTSGNENYETGTGTPLEVPHTAAGINTFVQMMRGLYDAVHYPDPTTGQRRFPDAFAGSNPTQEQERKGVVMDALHPSAIYHDFVMWSMYPPGRGVNDVDLAVNPRYDWPFVSTANEAQRNNIQQGYLLRCYYRTRQAELAAQASKPGHKLIIGTGEIGIASNPDDRTCRPYYAARLRYAQDLLATAYNLQQDFSCWWDSTVTNQTPQPKPHNVLTDEPPDSDHLSAGTGAALGNNATAANPSTAQAWRDYRSHVPELGGTTPAQWVGNPKGSWNTTGTAV